MTRRSPVSTPGLQRLGLLALLLLPIACQSPLEHRRSAYAAPEGREFTSWGDVFARPAPIRVTGLVTGWVEAGPEILIDAGDERVPESLREPLWVPSIAYLVEHPQGRLLLDAGVRAGECAYGLRPVYWVPCRNRPGSDALSQLGALGLEAADLDYVVISHFHGDHASGLEALTTAGALRVVSTRAEADAVARWARFLDGYGRELIPTRLDIEVIDDALRDTPILGPALDFFGDASLWLISTPGHTRGHLSALINAAPRPLLLTFDASHLEAGFTLGVVPGFRVDDERAADSLSRLRAFAQAHPEVEVLAGHEPSQWDREATRVVLAGGEEGEDR